MIMKVGCQEETEVAMSNKTEIRSLEKDTPLPKQITLYRVATLPTDLISTISSFLDVKEVQVVIHNKDRELAKEVKQTYLHRNFRYLISGRGDIRLRLSSWLAVNKDWRDLYDDALAGRLGEAGRTVYQRIFCDLGMAIFLNALDIVRHLIEVRNVDINKATRVGSENVTPLREAVRSANLDVLEYLLRANGLDVNGRNVDVNETPLFYLIARHTGEKLERLRMLLDHRDMDVDRATMEGITALHLVCNEMPSGAAEMIRLLIGAGANPNLLTSNGVTPLDLAQRSESLDSQAISLLLRQAGAVDLNKVGESECI